MGKISFETFLNQTGEEYSLLQQVAGYAQAHYSILHGPYCYIHLRDLKNGFVQIDEVKVFSHPTPAWRHLYIERDHEPFITVRPEKESMGLMLSGFKMVVELGVSKLEAILRYGPAPSILPKPGSKVMSSLDMMEAFGMISDAVLEQMRRKIS